MDKHFQEELHFTLSQSVWLQFAHYLGYFLMALTADWLAMRLGYRGGIMDGLLMVALEGLWFIPATQIAQFWAFLLGVCLIAEGLIFPERRWPSFFILPPSRGLPVSIVTASTLASLGFVCFLVARFIGAGLVKKFSAHMVLGIYGAVNALLYACVMLRLGWVSTVCVFLAYFFMSILFLTIFALGFQAWGMLLKKHPPSSSWPLWAGRLCRSSWATLPTSRMCR